VKWTKQEIEALKITYKICIDSELKLIFNNRTLNSIKVKAKRLGIKKNADAEYHNRSLSSKGINNGMYGKSSTKKNIKYCEFYGEKKAKIISDKISKSKKGKSFSSGDKNGMYGKKPWNKGRVATKEERKKLSIAIKKYWDELDDNEKEKRKNKLREEWLVKRDKYKEIDTVPEKIVEKILNESNIEYYKKIDIGYYNCDFVSNNNIIEVQGDYWHSNPNIYDLNKLDDIQSKNYNKDKRKKKYLIKSGYNILYLWEYDLKNDLESCRKQINGFFQKNSK
jgi:G:T-mismatch repair DNA endonuclease (very short patch repair protein)